MSNKEVRLATLDDVDSLLDLLKDMHEETGLFPLSEGKVGRIVQAAIFPTYGQARSAVVGVIGAPQALEASIALAPTQLYYTEAYHLGDMWHYVRPDCRNTEHADHLIAFAKACADKMGLDFISGVVSTDRTDAKMRLYRKHFGAFLGGYFMHRHMNGSNVNG